MTHFSVSSAAGTLCLLACICVVVAHDFTVCDDAPVAPTSVTVYPDPPAFGKDVTVTVTFNPDRVREPGATFEWEIDVIVTDFFQTRYEPRDRSSRNLCDYIKCPIEGDTLTVVYTQMIPDVGDSKALSFLGGLIDFRLRVRVMDNKGELVTCFELETGVESTSGYDNTHRIST